MAGVVARSPRPLLNRIRETAFLNSIYLAGEHERPTCQVNLRIPDRQPPTFAMNSITDGRSIFLPSTKNIFTNEFAV